MSLTSLGADEIARRLFRYDRSHAALTDKSQFGAGNLDQFRQDGFVAIEGLLSPSEIATATAALSFLIAGGNPAYAGVSLEDVAQGDRPGPADREPYVRKLLGFVDFEPRLALIAHHPSVLEIVERILGGPVRLVQDMALLKPAHIGREKPWHQDAAYFLLHPPESVLGVWIALDAATPGNGCMHVIPGTHRVGPQPHYHDRDCQLPDEEVAVDRDVMVPLAPGGALFFSSLLHHATPPNRSATRRRALQFHYAARTAHAIDATSHARLFHDGQGYAACAMAHTGIPPRPIVDRD